jgi:DNA-binding Xre family transcriptional regulator
MVTEKPINLELSKDLEDEEFRKHFFRSLAQMEVAEQIVKMRNRRTMRQVDLAEATEMKQSAISRIEQAGYASWNFQTLLRIAEALRARLRITLDPIEEVVTPHLAKTHGVDMQTAATGHSYDEASKAETPSVEIDSSLSLAGKRYPYYSSISSAAIGGLPT